MFWNWIRDDTGGRVLRLDGLIDEDDLWSDAVTPAAFREELMSDEGDITVWINSPGGSVWAAAEIYTMLKDYAGKVTVKIDAIAASAASVVAMAGDKVLMSPVAMIMIHDPYTVAMGNAKDMEKAIDTLNEVKESIINAYAAKSGMRRSRIAQMMSDETWMNAKKAVEYGFADEVMYADGERSEDAPGDEGEYSMKRVGQIILNRLHITDSVEEVQPRAREEPQIGMDGKTEDGAVPYQILRNQLEFLR